MDLEEEAVEAGPSSGTELPAAASSTPSADRHSPSSMQVDPTAADLTTTVIGETYRRYFVKFPGSFSAPITGNLR